MLQVKVRGKHEIYCWGTMEGESRHMRFSGNRKSVVGDFLFTSRAGVKEDVLFSRVAAMQWKRISYLGVIAGMLLASNAANVVLAEEMSSANYRVIFDDVSAGGGTGSSTNYQATDTISEFASPADENLASANYGACVGFQCLTSQTDQPAIDVRYTTSALDTPCVASTPDASLDQNIGAVSTTGVSTADRRFCVIVNSNDQNGLVVTVQSVNGGLKSVSDPSKVIASATDTLEAGKEGYGVCVSSASGLSAAAPFSGNCDLENGHDVGAVSTTSQKILEAAGVVTDGVGDILTKASASAGTQAADDYGDKILVIVTGRY